MVFNWIRNASKIPLTFFLRMPPSSVFFFYVHCSALETIFLSQENSRSHILIDRWLKLWFIMKYYIFSKRSKLNEVTRRTVHCWMFNVHVCATACESDKKTKFVMASHLGGNFEIFAITHFRVHWLYPSSDEKKIIGEGEIALELWIKWCSIFHSLPNMKMKYLRRKVFSFSFIRCVAKTDLHSKKKCVPNGYLLNFISNA